MRKLQRLALSYSVFTQVVGDALTVYWQKRSDGCYWAFACSDEHFMVCDVTTESVADFEASSLFNAGREVGSEDDALALGYYVANANPKILPRALDGRPAVRVTAAARTKNFKLRAITFYSGKDNGGVHSVNPLTDLSYNDISVRLYKPAEGNNSGWVDATQDDATMTVIDWDPLYPYEIIGGWVDIPDDLRLSFTDQWYLACIGLPDYAQYGIAVDFVSEVNLEAVGEARVVSDGRATQYLSPTIIRDEEGSIVANYHTNRIRWILKHPAGEHKRFQIFVETFA